MSDNKQHSKSVSEKRRKLLKASAATPLVATLAFGSGQAAATSAYQCMTKSIPTEGFKTEDTDQDMRTPASRWTKKNKPTYYEVNTIFYNVDGTDPAPDNPPKLGGYTEEPGFVLFMYEKNAAGGIVTPVQDTDVWPKFQLTGQTTNQPLFETCVSSLTATAIGINVIKGNIV